MPSAPVPAHETTIFPSLRSVLTLATQRNTLLANAVPDSKMSLVYGANEENAKKFFEHSREPEMENRAAGVSLCDTT